VSLMLRRVLAGLVCTIVSLLCVGEIISIASDKQEKAVVSPGGLIIAEVHTSGVSGATDSKQIYITLKQRGWPLEHTVYATSDTGAGLQVRWISPNHLAVLCYRCEDNQIFKQKSRWHDVLITYSAVDGVPQPSPDNIAIPDPHRALPQPPAR
jgi:hypothetical protein